MIASDAGEVDRVDPTAGRVVARIAVGNGPSAVAVTDGAVWVANFSDDTVTRIDPSTSAVAGGPIAVGDGPTAIAADANGAWVTSINDGLLTHVDPAGDSTSSIRVGNGPEGVAIATSGVWVTNSLDGTLSEIDTERMAIATTIPVGDGPTGITYGNASLWVANRYGGSIAKVDPRTAQADRIGVAGQPVASVFAGNDLWVATLASPTAHLGGVLQMASQYAPDTIDPATAYSPESWSILSMTNDGLVAFQRVGGPQGAAVVPDLATSIPRPSDGGKTYTFQLRPGIRYSDGGSVRAGDLRLALERMFAQGGGLAPYFMRIVGAGACARQPATCDLSDGVVTNDSAGTVTIHLTQPDPELLYALALPAAFAVPEGTPKSRITTTPIPATGPYRITTYTSGNHGSIQLQRNPRFQEWSRAAKPDGYVDTIDWEFGMSPDEQIAAVEDGHLDYATDTPLPRFHEIRAQYPSQIFEEPATATLGFAFNVTQPPFDDIRVRRAVQFAVDRARMVAGAVVRPLTVTCQVLPKDFPSHRPYCPYTSHPDTNGTWSGQDLGEALRLVAASGTQGASITVWAPGNATVAAREVSRELSTLGYRSSVHIIANLDPYFNALYDPTNRIQIGFAAWGADFPAPSGFMTPLFSCGNVPPHGSGTNASYFCDPVVERAMHRALVLQASDPAGANAAWADVDRMITDRSPFLAYANPSDLYFVSDRVGNVQINPQWALLFDQLWVN